MRYILPLSILSLPLLCICWFDSASVKSSLRSVKLPVVKSLVDSSLIDHDRGDHQKSSFHRNLQECSAQKHVAIINHEVQVPPSRQIPPFLKQSCLVIASGLLAFSSSLSSSAQSLGTKVDIGERVLCENLQLEQLTKEGAGGGGTVFSAVKQGGSNSDKVSIRQMYFIIIN